MATPGITLTATLADISNNAVGTTTKPSKIRITLCGFGATLPCIPGTCNIDKPGPTDYFFTGSLITIHLWGNDVIVPGNTFYSIELLDDSGNIVQTGMYQFTGTETIDLSNAPQITQPAQQAPYIGYYSLTWSGSGSSLLSGAVADTFDILLQANFSPTISGITKGKLIKFFFQQDGVGGRTVTWPGNVINPPLIDPSPNTVTTCIFMERADGNLYPATGWSA